MNNILHALLLLPPTRFRKLIRLYFKSTSPEFIEIIESELYKQARYRKYQKAVIWMENRAKKNPKLEPRQLAYSFIKTTGSSMRMFPWLLIEARKVKDRLRKRKLNGS